LNSGYGKQNKKELAINNLIPVEFNKDHSESNFKKVLILVTAGNK
jgi:hypothetical protein